MILSVWELADYFESDSYVFRIPETDSAAVVSDYAPCFEDSA